MKQFCSWTLIPFTFFFPSLFPGGPKSSGFAPVINHGRVTDGQKPLYSVGDFITIECYAGYTLHGEARIQYTGENRWVPGVPTCQLSKYELQEFPLE